MNGTNIEKEVTSKMRNDINGIIAEIAKKIEAEGRETIFTCFEHTDSIGLGIDGADV